MNCQKCGSQVNEGAKFCRKCGSEIVFETEVLYGNTCSKCGNLLAGNALFCNNCGHKLSEEYMQTDIGSKEPYCNSPLKDGELFCGARVKSLEEESEKSIYSVTQKKKDKGLICLIVLLAVVLIASVSVVGYIYFWNSPVNIQTPNLAMATDNKAEELDIDGNGDVLPNEACIAEDLGGAEYMDEKENSPQNDTPIFTEVLATTTLSSDGNNTYGAYNLIDEDNSTAWVEGVNDSGIGQRIIFKADSPQTVNNIQILNGYCKTRDLYQKNNRVKTINIIFPDGTTIRKSLTDVYAEYQLLVFDTPIVCDEFSIEIQEVYTGSKYNDTCISEILIG